jgi:hypothetical protein
VLAAAREVVLEFHGEQLIEQQSDPSQLMRQLFGLTDSITVLDVRNGPRQPLELEHGSVPQGNATLAFSVRRTRANDEAS